MSKPHLQELSKQTPGEKDVPSKGDVDGSLEPWRKVVVSGITKRFKAKKDSRWG